MFRQAKPSLFMVSKQLVQNEDKQEVQKQAQKAQLRAKFSGKWIKDVERSDSMDEVLDVMQIGGLIRSAMKLIRGIQIEYTEDYYKASVFSVIPWFKVTEQYPTAGGISCHRRRDLRGGKHTGHIEEKFSKVFIHSEWNDPFGGSSTEIMSLPTENELHHETNMFVGGKTVSYTIIYNKQK